MVSVVICFHVAEAKRKQMIKIRLDGLGNEYALLTCPLIAKSPMTNLPPGHLLSLKGQVTHFPG